MASSNWKILDHNNLPSSALKLSKIDRNEIDVLAGFDAQLTKVQNSYENLAKSMEKVSAQAKKAVNNYSKYFDNSRKNSLKKFAKAMASQAQGCRNRKKEMKEYADATKTQRRKIDEGKAWSAAIDVILKETNLSDNAKSTLSALKKYFS